MILMAKEQGLRKAACVIDEMLSATRDNSIYVFSTTLVKSNKWQIEQVFKSL